MQDDTQTPLPPERIGTYQRVGESPLGEGGMGVVWLYRETSISSREVAIKFIRPDENAELNKASLIKDIKGMEALPLHQNIITMHTVIEEQGNIALVMEYVPGGITLKKVIQENPKGLPIPLAKEILVGVLSGVAHAHEHGVIHRDLKPDNILMRQPKQGAKFNRNSAKIADFGISKVHRDGTRRLSTVVAFTEAYAAPEQINGEETGGFTDVYAIGVVLYEMLAGRKPFEGKTIEILTGHCFKPPPPIDRNDLPSGLKKLLDKALRKEPAARCRDAIEMLTEYQELDRTGELGQSSPQTETTTPVEVTAENQVPEDHDKVLVSEEKKIVAPEPAVQKDEAEKLREEEAKHRTEEEARRNAEDEARRRAEEESHRQAATETEQEHDDYAKTIVSGEKKKVTPSPSAQAEAAAERRRAEEQAKREFEARRKVVERKSGSGSKIIGIATATMLLVAIIIFLRRETSEEPISTEQGNENVAQQNDKAKGYGQPSQQDGSYPSARGTNTSESSDAGLKATEKETKQQAEDRLPLAPTQVRVPNVANLSQAVAEAAITSVGLTIGTVTTENSGTVGMGDVIASSPASGRSVDAGTAVNLRVSSGPALVQVPTVIGITQSEAEARLSSAGLKLGRVTTENYPSMRAGMITASDPTSGNFVAPGTFVNLTVSNSSGPATANPTPSGTTASPSAPSGTNELVTREPLAITEDNIKGAKATINRLMPKFTFKNNRNGVSCTSKSLVEFENTQKKSYFDTKPPYGYYSLFPEIKDGKLVAYSRWNYKMTNPGATTKTNTDSSFEINHNKIMINSSVYSVVQLKKSKVENVWSLADGLITEEGTLSEPERILYAIDANRYRSIRAAISGVNIKDISLARENIDAIAETVELYNALTLLQRAGVKIQGKY